MSHPNHTIVSTSITKPMSGRLKLNNINDAITCPLCHGYFIEPTTINSCMHSFCRSCIVKYLQNNNFCPCCNTSREIKIAQLRPDQTLKSIVYKLVPGLFKSEKLRMRKFYEEKKSNGFSSSEDFDDDEYFSTVDPISLSLEYHPKSVADIDKSELPPIRYLQCPGGFTVSHLRRYIAAKYSLVNADIQIIYEDEVLPTQFSLIDIAYCFNWKRLQPMQIFYQIFCTSPDLQLANEIMPPPLPPPSTTIVSSSDHSFNISAIKPIINQQQPETHLTDPIEIIDNYSPAIIKNINNNYQKDQDNQYSISLPQPNKPIKVTFIKNNNNKNDVKPLVTQTTTIPMSPKSTSDFKSLRSNDIKYSSDLTEMTDKKVKINGSPTFISQQTKETANDLFSSMKRQQEEETHRQKNISKLTLTPRVQDIDFNNADNNSPSPTIIVSIPKDRRLSLNDDNFENYSLSTIKTANKKSKVDLKHSYSLDNSSSTMTEIPKLKIELASLKTKITVPKFPKVANRRKTVYAERSALYNLNDDDDEDYVPNKSARSSKSKMSKSEMKRRQSVYAERKPCYSPDDEDFQPAKIESKRRKSVFNFEACSPSEPDNENQFKSSENKRKSSKVEESNKHLVSQTIKVQNSQSEYFQKSTKHSKATSNTSFNSQNNNKSNLIDLTDTADIEASSCPQINRVDLTEYAKNIGLKPISREESNEIKPPTGDKADNDDRSSTSSSSSHKKRKKSDKHSRESGSKRPKLHAEISSQEEKSLKLKVKITKKHERKNSNASSSSDDCVFVMKNDKDEVVPSTSSSSNQNKIEKDLKEKLLELRQVRHKPARSIVDQEAPQKLSAKVATLPISDNKPLQNHPILPTTSTTPAPPQTYSFIKPKPSEQKIKAPIPKTHMPGARPIPKTAIPGTSKMFSPSHLHQYPVFTPSKSLPKCPKLSPKLLSINNSASGPTNKRPPNVDTFQVAPKQPKLEPTLARKNCIPNLIPTSTAAAKHLSKNPITYDRYYNSPMSSAYTQEVTTKKPSPILLPPSSISVTKMIDASTTPPLPPQNTFTKPALEIVRISSNVPAIDQQHNLNPVIKAYGPPPPLQSQQLPTRPLPQTIPLVKIKKAGSIIESKSLSAILNSISKQQNKIASAAEGNEKSSTGRSEKKTKTPPPPLPPLKPAVAVSNVVCDNVGALDLSGKSSRSPSQEKSPKSFSPPLPKSLSPKPLSPSTTPKPARPVSTEQKQQKLENSINNVRLMSQIKVQKNTAESNGSEKTNKKIVVTNNVQLTPSSSTLPHKLASDVFSKLFPQSSYTVPTSIPTLTTNITIDSVCNSPALMEPTSHFVTLSPTPSPSPPTITTDDQNNSEQRLQNLKMLSESALNREKLPTPKSSTTTANRQITMPKLNEINKSRNNMNVRQQNASLRNIPNPSALAFRHFNAMQSSQAQKSATVTSSAQNNKSYVPLTPPPMLPPALLAVANKPSTTLSTKMSNGKATDTLTSKSTSDIIKKGTNTSMPSATSTTTIAITSKEGIHTTNAKTTTVTPSSKPGITTTTISSNTPTTTASLPNTTNSSSNTTNNNLNNNNDANDAKLIAAKKNLHIEKVAATLRATAAASSSCNSSNTGSGATNNNNNNNANINNAASGTNSSDNNSSSSANTITTVS